MKRPLLLAFALAAITATGAREASAQQGKGFSTNRFEPSERGSDFFALESLDLRGHLRPAFGIVGDWAYRPLVLYDTAGNVRDAVVKDQVVVHPGVSLVLWDRVRVAASLPVQVFADGQGGVLNGTYYAGASSDPALGDLRVGADVRIFGEYRTPLSVAAGVQAWVPTGDTASYSGDGSGRLAPRVLLAGGVGPVQYAARVGFAYRGRDDTFGGSPLGSELLFGAGGGVRVLDDKLLFSAELTGSSATADVFRTRTTPLEGIVGARSVILGDLRAGAGLGVGLARGYGTPAVRGLLALEYAPQARAEVPRADRDKDGIFDDEDACPDVAGVASRDPKTNGCPTRTDRDKDGVFDDEDACVDLPGPRTDDPRTNGCPPDTDGDGVVDPIDACPSVPGVEQADPKKNGCPPDSDDDGIIDEEDACPDVPGIKSSDPKFNGCPDPDRDKDGVLNDQDACPDEAGKPDPDPKRNGCPKAFVRGGQIRILDQVKFMTGSAAILPGKDSQEVLEAVLKVMTDHPEINRVRVEGHTDNQGSAALNKKLSADRAATVVRWLVSHGIDAGRLTSQGFGPDRPLDSNATDAGRKNNRRVEFHIEEPVPAAAPEP